MSGAAAYHRHRPEETPLHGIVREHLESFLAHVEEQGGKRLPRYVTREFWEYVECGILAHGFSRARCTSCGHEIVVAFSCKKRGVCPSCNARRMSDTAARLVDHILPDLRLRQWVLSVPFELRLLLATKPQALSVVGKIFCQEIARWQCDRAQALGHTRVRGGAICFPQRFGGSLNLNVHYHVVAPDAAFAKVGDCVETIELAAPTLADLNDVAMNTALRVIDWLKRKGFVDSDSTEDTQNSPLMRCLQGSLGVGDLHPATRQSPVGTEIAPPRAKKGMLGEYARFNVHAGVSVAAGCPQERERLLRYCARAPLSLERLSVLDDGRIAYRVKHAHRGRPAVRIMTPIQFMARLAALIPPPRHPLIRFHGVFAPNNKWRSAVVPTPIPISNPHCGAAPHAHGATDETAVTARTTDTAQTNSLLHARTPDAPLKFPTRIDWATLLRRVYNIDALACPECDGRLRFVEVIEAKTQARAALDAMGLPSQPPPLARARAPDWQDN